MHFFALTVTLNVNLSKYFYNCLTRSRFLLLSFNHYVQKKTLNIHSFPLYFILFFVVFFLLRCLTTKKQYRKLLITGHFGFAYSFFFNKVRSFLMCCKDYQRKTFADVLMQVPTFNQHRLNKSLRYLPCTLYIINQYQIKELSKSF